MQAHLLVSATYEVKMNSEHREAAEEKAERWEERVPTEKTPSATTEKTLRCYVRGLHTRRRRNQAETGSLSSRFMLLTGVISFKVTCSAT